MKTHHTGHRSLSREGKQPQAALAGQAAFWAPRVPRWDAPPAPCPQPRSPLQPWPCVSTHPSCPRPGVTQRGDTVKLPSEWGWLVTPNGETWASTAGGLRRERGAGRGGGCSGASPPPRGEAGVPAPCGPRFPGSVETQAQTGPDPGRARSQPPRPPATTAPSLGAGGAGELRVPPHRVCSPAALPAHSPSDPVRTRHKHTLQKPKVC